MMRTFLTAIFLALGLTAAVASQSQNTRNPAGDQSNVTCADHAKYISQEAKLLPGAIAIDAQYYEAIVAAWERLRANVEGYAGLAVRLGAADDWVFISGYAHRHLSDPDAVVMVVVFQMGGGGECQRFMIEWSRDFWTLLNIIGTITESENAEEAAS